MAIIQGAAATDVVAFASISVVGATAVGATDFITNTGIDTTISVGDVFIVTSASEPLKVNGTYTCINNSTTDQITIYPSFPDDTAAAVDLVVYANLVLTNGADTPESYTFRKRAVNDSLDYFWYYRGCKVNTMSFEFSTGSILKGSFGIVGLTEEPRDTVLTGEQTDLPVPSYDIMNSVTSVGSIHIEGVTLGKCSFSNLSVSVDNQINTAKSIGTLGACASAAFSLQVTSSTEVFFENLDLYNKFKDATAFGITLILTDATGNSIGINMPKCKFETLDTPIDGKDSFLMQSGTIRALRDDTSNYMIKFSFASV